MNRRRIIKLLLLLFWMGVIFYFSSQNGETSEELSDSLLSPFYFLYKGPLSLLRFLRRYGVYIRKAAHFCEYALLGILMHLSISEYKKDAAGLSLLLSSLYAVSDEVHQLFVSERAFGLLDILIDSLGAAFGILLLILVKKLVSKKRLDYNKSDSDEG
jgi:VanZ family protein